MREFEAAKAIIARLAEDGAVALLAGGCVRDRLLGIEPKDYDVATDATPDRICRLFRRTRKVGVQFGVVLVRMKGCEIQVATFRTDGDYEDGRHPVAVEFTTAEADARRRDFTINGMFLDPADDRIVDYVGGREDIDRRLVRCIGDPRQRFAEDHLRMLRAVRFAARLEFDIESGTLAAIREHAERIRQISAERIRMELELILQHPSRARGWRLIGETGLRDHLAEGISFSTAEAARAEAVLAALPEQVSLPVAMASVAINFSAEDGARMCDRLRSSVALSRGVEYLLRHVGPIVAPCDWELADVKLLRADDRFEDLLCLANAVVVADGTAPRALEEFTQRALAIAPADAAPPPFVTGEDLLARKVPAGPRFGVVLDELYRAQLNEEIASRGEALEMLKRLLEPSG